MAWACRYEEQAEAMKKINSSLGRAMRSAELGEPELPIMQLFPPLNADEAPSTLWVPNA